MIGRAIVAAALALGVGACGVQANESDSASAASATNVAVPTISEIDVAALERLTAEDKAVLVDVRTPEEFAQGHIVGAINLPLRELDPGAVPHEAGKRTVLYCHSGRRSQTAAEKMVAAGETTTHLSGGIAAWEAAGQPVTPAS